MKKELKINNKIFVMSDTDYLQLNDTHRKTLQKLSTLSEDLYPELHNPVVTCNFTVPPHQTFLFFGWFQSNFLTSHHELPFLKQLC